VCAAWAQWTRDKLTGIGPSPTPWRAGRGLRRARGRVPQFNARPRGGTGPRGSLERLERDDDFRRRNAVIRPENASCRASLLASDRIGPGECSPASGANSPSPTRGL